jgi:hypothetical protein
MIPPNTVTKMDLEIRFSPDAGYHTRIRPLARIANSGLLINTDLIQAGDDYIRISIQNTTPRKVTLRAGTTLLRISAHKSIITADQLQIAEEKIDT